ncbi:hypothetical protein [Synechococcus sp. PCC 6312]|uniref:hypothetical protein n=1 Tax=Synechococcus sp. (strain ATCC 27167 / PCC 6312) TaxID=195253 RepID=UPI00029EE267|nr:hypothetical protein [Synechococcus sp. PCC 6312]AFY62373.1 hypothetical protein Syn6312_3335 [Synechococcus sp. PCC 6312]
MANPTPVLTPEFVAQIRKPIGAMPDEPLEQRPLALKVGKSVFAAIHQLPQAERITWLRRVITEAAQRELMS